MNNRLRNILKNPTILLWILAGLFAFLSILPWGNMSAERKAHQVEKQLHRREKILQDYVDKAFDTPNDRWLRFEDFPNDMVLYKYVDDTLQSWVNLFPLRNDGIKPTSYWYRIHDLGNINSFNTPLAFLKDGVQFINLGPSWYLIKTQTEGKVKVISAIEIMRQYTHESKELVSGCNEYLKLSDKDIAVPTYIDDNCVIHTADGEPAFSLLKETSDSISIISIILRWITIILGIVAFFLYQYRHNSMKTLYYILGVIFLLQISTFFIVHDMPYNREVFSPMLYADGLIFNSFGTSIFFDLFIFLYSTALYIARKPIIRNILTTKDRRRKNLKKCTLVLVAIGIALYTHISLISLITNSNIILDLYRINSIDFYTILAYSMYALLCMSLMFVLTITFSVFYSKKRKNKRRWNRRLSLLYVLLSSIYIVSMVNHYEFRKEFENMRIISANLSVERDLMLEMHLLRIEHSIMTDPLIKRFTGVPNADRIILNRLGERYFSKILPKYDIRVTICGPDDNIISEEYIEPINCFNFYSDIVDNYGVRLHTSTAFYFLDYFRDRTSYLGAFTILRSGNRYDLYIEINSKISAENTGYPSFIVHDDYHYNERPPYPYSYARYHQGKLTTHHGKYNFPVSINIADFPYGFSTTTIDDNVFFVNKMPNDNIVSITRPNKGIFLHFISLSYIMLFFGGIIIGIPRLFKRKKTKSLLYMPKKSFRLKLTTFFTASIVVSLVLMAIASIFAIAGYLDNFNNSIMEEKLTTVQSSLNQMGKKSEVYNSENTQSVLDAMNIIAKNAQVDINLFDPHGRLIQTTNPEVFNEYLANSRMNPDAYYEIVEHKRASIMQVEYLSNIQYYSLYTPILNEYGDLLAIANIPYFITDSGYEYDVSPIIAAIINVYIILILVAFFVGVGLSNSITKPLKEISLHMHEFDIDHRAHINYDSNDELGQLVKAYNKMTDDLQHSTRLLAESEREQAWREMARQIAHEIKNPLTPMRLSIQHLVRMKKMGTDNWQEKFEQLATSLIEQIDILSNTASEFSSFAKFYNEDAAEVDLVDIIREQKILFDNHDNIEMQIYTMLNSAKVYARKSQITRVFINLISNAIQAIEDIEHGIIRITLVEEDLFYKVEIEDNGSGISEENLGKIFRPNFTTKTSGTGLGLAICYNIIIQSHGDITYKRSTDLGGAEFIIILPKF